MINLTSGYALSLNETSPGVSSFWICNERATPTTSTGAITAFTTPQGTTPEWYEFECALNEGDWTSTPSAGSGGLEYILAANFRIGGLSEAKLEQLDNILKSQKMSVVSKKAGNYYLLSEAGATATTGSITSGTAGGGALSVGSSVAFAASDETRPRAVTITTDLDAITSASS